MFQYYFVEIKNRLMLIFLAWFFTLCFCYSYKHIIVFISIKTLLATTSNTIGFISTTVTEIFNSYLQFSLFISNQITFTVLLYHILKFLSPGLYLNEIKRVNQLFFLFLINISCSTALLNLFFIPISLDFFLNFTAFSNELAFEAKITEYLNFYKSMYYYLIFSNQTLLLIFYIVLYKIQTAAFYIKVRKLFYLIFLMAATFITPPDIFTQILLYITLVLLYESIIFTCILKKYVLIR